MDTPQKRDRDRKKLQNWNRKQARRKERAELKKLGQPSSMMASSIPMAVPDPSHLPDGAQP